MPKIHILKPGRHYNGKYYDFTTNDLKAIADNYDASHHKAPITPGHVKQGTPALGWVNELECDEKGNLYAHCDFTHALEGAITEGFYKKVSAGFLSPSSGSNQTKNYALNHVAILGAQPPAVKGLEEISFQANNEDIITFDEWNVASALDGLNELMRNLRDFMIEKFGKKTTDEVLSSWVMDRVADNTIEHRQDAREASTTEIHYNQPANEDTTMTPEEKQQFEQTQKDLADAKAQLHNFEQARINQSAVDFAEKAIEDGKITPAQKDTVVQLHTKLQGGDVVEFSEDTNKALQEFEALIAGMTPQVNFAELTPSDEMVEFTSAEDLADKASAIMVDYASKGQTISSAQAVALAKKQ